MPQLGDVFPDFTADTNAGPLHFFDWAEGHWTHLFSHPAARTPVCTTEVAALASAVPDFDERNVKLLGFTGSSTEDQESWHADIERLFDVNVDFPFVADEGCRMARKFGMLHDKQSATMPIRKSFILDPQMRIRMIFEYPIYIGRGTEEILRVIDSLQIMDKTGLAVPADWEEGDELLFTENMPDTAARQLYGDKFTRLTDYLAVVRQPAAARKG
ncbi:redoxin domain-containing protein [Rhodobacteraceae bacterium ASV31]|nr:redoxin domain-containing protein [Anianabacter salinae]